VVSLDLPPVYDELAFLSPLSEDRAAGLVSFLAEGLSDGGTVLDIGCGWGELLLRVAATATGCTAIGVDLDTSSLAEGSRRAEARGLSDRVAFLTGKGKHVGPAAVDALICIGATQVWGPSAEEAQPLAYASAFDAIRGRVRDGGRVVYADGIWSKPPTPEATAPLAGRDDEFVTLDELVVLAEEAGFVVDAADEATLDEWDAFEGGYVAGYDTWLAAHSPDDPDADEVRSLADRQRAAYADGYRGVLGMGYLLLTAT
jgi:cyclopropane fatty-acyl-phospholipid synthase-like methyltransferase